MFHRRFFFGRIVLFMLLMGGLFSVGRGLFRSGYEQGFVQGMGFAAGSGQPAAPGVPDAPTAPRVYGQWRGGPFGPAERGFMGFSLVGFAFLTFFALMLFGALGRRHHHWAGHGSHHGHWGHHRRDGRRDIIGPEKQPEDFL